MKEALLKKIIKLIKLIKISLLACNFKKFYKAFSTFLNKVKIVSESGMFFRLFVWILLTKFYSFILTSISRCDKWNSMQLIHFNDAYNEMFALNMKCVVLKVHLQGYAMNFIALASIICRVFLSHYAISNKLTLI